MMQIAYTVHRTTVHNVTIAMQHHGGQFPTSNKIQIVGNKLRMLKNEFNIPNTNLVSTWVEKETQFHYVLMIKFPHNLQFAVLPNTHTHTHTHTHKHTHTHTHKHTHTHCWTCSNLTTTMCSKTKTTTTITMFLHQQPWQSTHLKFWEVNG